MARFQRVTMIVSYEREAGIDLPSRIRATANDMDVDAAVRYRSSALGAGVDPARFHLALPASVKIQRFR